MFGYATTETPQLMPMAASGPRTAWPSASPRCAARARCRSCVPTARRRSRSATTAQTPKTVESVVLSTQHHPDISQKALRAAVRAEVIDPVLEATGLDLPDVKFYINPAGPFVTGGPKGDAGLTGRKIIIDTYGGASRHGGGAFSGKDPSKVDRSAAYAMRWVAKNAVAAGLADRLEVQVAYAIGKAKPGRALRRDVRHRTRLGRRHHARDPRGVRPAPEGDHRPARPAAPDLRADGRLRPLRPRAARLHVGAHRPRRRPARRRRAVSPPGPDADLAEL